MEQLAGVMDEVRYAYIPMSNGGVRQSASVITCITHAADQFRHASGQTREKHHGKSTLW